MKWIFFGPNVCCCCWIRNGCRFETIVARCAKYTGSHLLYPNFSNIEVSRKSARYSRVFIVNKLIVSGIQWNVKGNFYCGDKEYVRKIGSKGRVLHFAMKKEILVIHYAEVFIFKTTEVLCFHVPIYKYIFLLKTCWYDKQKRSRCRLCSNNLWFSFNKNNLIVSHNDRLSVDRRITGDTSVAVKGFMQLSGKDAQPGKSWIRHYASTHDLKAKLERQDYRLHWKSTNVQKRTV